MLVTSAKNIELIRWLVEIDRAVSKGVSEPILTSPPQTLREALLEPYRMDYDRTPVHTLTF